MPFKTEIKKVKQEVVTECTCDECGITIIRPEPYGLPTYISVDGSTHGYNGLILQHTGGFYSKHDCKTETLVLCDDCFFKLVKEIKSKK